MFDIRQWRNEPVALLGLIGTIAAQVAAALDGADLDDPAQWIALMPIVVTIVARRLSWGPLTVEALEDAAATREAHLVERIVELEADR